MKNCKTCHAEFEAKNKRNIYCGRYCAVNEITKCTLCDTEFTRQRNKKAKPYCSKKCRNIDTGRTLLLKCSLCEKEFYRSHSMSVGKESNFCSVMCQDNSLKNKVERTCVECGVVFSVIPANSINRKYCSHECRRKYLEKDDLVYHYVEQGLSAEATGFELGVSENTVLKELHRHKIDTRDAGFGISGVSDDGTHVRSSYGMLVSNKLSEAKLSYEYDVRLPFKRGFLTDFLVGDVYVEVWGIVNYSPYQRRMELKKKLYKEHGVKLVSIYPQDLKNLDLKIDEIKNLMIK